MAVSLGSAGAASRSRYSSWKLAISVAFIRKVILFGGTTIVWGDIIVIRPTRHSFPGGYFHGLLAGLDKTIRCIGFFVCWQRCCCISHWRCSWGLRVAYVDGECESQSANTLAMALFMAFWCWFIPARADFGIWSGCCSHCGY